MEQTILSSSEFQISLLLFVALAGYLIAYRINQSAVVGIIFAGILVGPSVFGLVTYTDFWLMQNEIGRNCKQNSPLLQRKFPTNAKKLLSAPDPK